MTCYKVIKFYSDSCGPCKAMAPIVSAVTNERGIKLVEMNVGTEEGLSMARSFGVRQVPTFVLDKNGETVGMKVGAMPEDEFVKFIEEKG